MALRQITCPHCDQDVEVDVTSASDSCACPNCGKSIALEITPGQKRSRRTTVIAPSVDPVEKLGEARHGDHTGPRPLEGNVHERMLHDPDVRRNIRRLAWGSGIVAAIIILLCVADYGNWWSVFGSAAPARPSKAPVTSNTPPAPAPPQQAKQQPYTEPPAEEEPVTPPVVPVKVSPPSEPAPVPPSPPVNVEETALSEEDRATEAVKAFLEAKNVDERLEFVRDVAAMESIIRAYYSRHPDGPIAFTRIVGDPRTSKKSNIRKLQVELADGRKRTATVGRVGSGEYRVDWASFVVYSPMDWSEFMEKRPTEPLFMRVLIAPADASAPAFGAPEQYLCVKITDPVSVASPPIYGYIEKRFAESLKLILRTYGGDPFPMVLTLKYPAQPESPTGPANQVLIDKVLGEGWLANGT
jgi:hypothetical protein